MARYQITNGVSIRRIKIQSLDATVVKLQADVNVIRTRDGFARIMQQQCQIKKLRLFKFAEQFTEALIPFRFRFLQAMEIFDCQERGLIDRVAMIKTAPHERLNPLELR